MKPGILAVDIGGSGLKAAVIDSRGGMISERLRVPTPHPCPPELLLDSVVALVAPLPGYDRISIGFPGVVRYGRVLTAPNLDTALWAGFPLAEALSDKLGGKPARLINDADMQGYGLIAGSGLELVITLGTGFGSALFREGELMPHMELAHHPLHKRKTYNEYLGAAELERVGQKRWNRRLERTLTVLETLLHPDHIFIGGGNARHVSLALPQSISLGSNAAGLEGGAALWRRVPRTSPGTTAGISRGPPRRH